MERKRGWVDAADTTLSVSRQCQLLDLSRSSYYYEPATESAENLALMALIDREYTAHPFLGSRRLTIWLRGEGHAVNRKRVQRLMQVMGLRRKIKAKKRRTTNSQPAFPRYPNLVEHLLITRPDQVWVCDLTWIHLRREDVYLAAIMDVFTRSIRGWYLGRRRGS